MTLLNEASRAALTAGHLAHLVTLDPDDSPQVSIVWTGIVLRTTPARVFGVGPWQ